MHRLSDFRVGYVFNAGAWSWDEQEGAGNSVLFGIYDPRDQIRGSPKGIVYANPTPQRSLHLQFGLNSPSWSRLDKFHYRQPMLFQSPKSTPFLPRFFPFTDSVGLRGNPSSLSPRFWVKIFFCSRLSSRIDVFCLFNAPVTQRPRMRT